MAQSELSPEQTMKLIREQITVPPDHIARAKRIILERASGSDTNLGSSFLINSVLRANGVELPKRVKTHSSADPHVMISKVAEALSWQIAAAEAILSLLHSGVLVPMSPPRSLAPAGVSYSTAPPKSGGQSGGWTFDETAICLPGFVRLAPSQATKDAS